VYNQQNNRVFENWLVCIISGYYPPTQKNIDNEGGNTLTLIDNRRVLIEFLIKYPLFIFKSNNNQPTWECTLDWICYKSDTRPDINSGSRPQRCVWAAPDTSCLGKWAVREEKKEGERERKLALLLYCLQ